MRSLERKIEHIRVCLERDVESARLKTGFRDVHLVHSCLPELDLSEVSLEAEFLGRRFSAPIAISALTGGPHLSTLINRSLAEASQRLNIPLELGSQRLAIEEPSLRASFKQARELSPDGFIVANVGAVQAASKGVEFVKEAVDMVEANAVAVHLNPLQEAIQPEGEAWFQGVLETLKELSSQVGVPVIVKEIGCGVAYEEASAIEKAGASAIDVAGVGGTSWAAIEAYRALSRGDEKSYQLGMAFRDWGIPTAASIVEARLSTRLPIIGSGGVRSGIDAAKAIALGADLVGMALPLLKPALVGSWAVVEFLERVMRELRLSMFLTGSKRVEDLKRARVVITGFTAEWLKARGFDVSNLARRA
ncbi:MAG: type 2 isopentenyl-diphosphate Delta-isomerase [Candidatus Nezhaarchaeota archaeon]|nr:type 2 isopentenyl-diphosphate Delta-isomerase [Candidatus Nezhaarchaeota archaeon]